MYDTNTIPPMPALDCPTWCEVDHEADWRHHVEIGLDTRRIPDGKGGFMSDEHRTPFEKWCTLPYFACTHRRLLATVPTTEPDGPFTIELDRDSDGTALYVAGEGPMDAARARQLAAELLDAANRLDCMAESQ